MNNNAGNRSSPDGKTSPESVGRDDRHSDQSDDGLAEKSGLYTGQKVPLHWNFYNFLYFLATFYIGYIIPLQAKQNNELLLGILVANK